MKTCNKCMESAGLSQIRMSSADFQRNEQRHECRERRLVTALIVAIVASFLSPVLVHVGWLIHERDYHVNLNTEDTAIVEETSPE